MILFDYPSNSTFSGKPVKACDNFVYAWANLSLLADLVSLSFLVYFYNKSTTWNSDVDKYSVKGGFKAKINTPSEIIQYITFVNKYFMFICHKFLTVYLHFCQYKILLFKI